ncbi:hypothetical protein [Nocardia callitridis]|uniref:Uncharacterized protein n=1 Tax=Nocardia callitridis TaxID=648753 RepID=A0ABP9KYB2_9NOCA
MPLTALPESRFDRYEADRLPTVALRTQASTDAQFRVHSRLQAEQTRAA